MEGRVVCARCRYFYTTWDNRLPYGCRAHGFKSARPPSEVVRQSSGRECLSYQEKGEPAQSNER